MRSERSELSELGTAVEAWRQQHGLSQAALARIIGTHRRTLCDWLRRETLPSAVIPLARLATLLGTTLEDLLGGTLTEPAFRIPMRCSRW